MTTSQRKIPVHQPSHFVHSAWRNGAPVFKPVSNETGFKVCRAHIVRYGRDFIKNGPGEGTIVEDQSRMEAPPVVVFASEAHYNRFRMDSYHDDDYDADVDNSEILRVIDEDNMAAQDEMNRWGDM